MAHQDRAAFIPFTKAGGQNYPAAEKYLGDAFLEGRGLPNAEKQDAHTALYWYQRAAQDGFPDGDLAVKETKDAIDRATFDPSGFQYGDYMAKLYTGKFDDVKMRPLFLHYVRGVIEELGSDKLLYVDQHCKPLVTQLGTLSLDVAQVLSYVDALKNEGKTGIVVALESGAASSFAHDAGQRDAVVLINRYKCDSDVARQITNNIVINYSDWKNKSFSKFRSVEGGYNATDGSPDPSGSSGDASNSDSGAPTAPNGRDAPSNQEQPGDQPQPNPKNG
ncbi:MAG: hypothetical protein ABSD74_00160 [Rhizomicrobium sp.]